MSRVLIAKLKNRRITIKEARGEYFVDFKKLIGKSEGGGFTVPIGTMKRGVQTVKVRFSEEGLRAFIAMGIRILETKPKT